MIRLTVLTNSKFINFQLIRNYVTQNIFLWFVFLIDSEFRYSITFLWISGRFCFTLFVDSKFSDSIHVLDLPFQNSYHHTLQNNIEAKSLKSRSSVRQTLMKHALRPTSPRRYIFCACSSRFDLQSSQSPWRSFVKFRLRISGKQKTERSTKSMKRWFEGKLTPSRR